MTFTSRRSSWSRNIAGMLTLLIACLLVLISYATDAGWTQPRTMTGSVTSDTPEETVGEPGSVMPPAAATVTHHGATRQPANAGDGPNATGAVGIGDGYIPDGQVLSPWDTDHPAVGNLDPNLLDAVQQAATDADADGIVMVVNSGWRSERYQQSLLDEAIVTYGSEKEARKWVNTPDASTHVTGDGVDIGYTDADYWLIEHGNEYGLCQTYANEIWHFELAVEPGETCPPPLHDATAGAS